MMQRHLLTFAALALATLAACEKEEFRGVPKTCEEDPTMAHCPKPCDRGWVTGRVCAPDQQTFVGGATVFAAGECQGQTFNERATADGEGRFTMNLPAGTHNITALSGSFSRSYSVTVDADGTTQIPDDQLCFRREEAPRIAAITGINERMEDLLNELGLDVDVYGGTADTFLEEGEGFDLLTDPQKLAEYDVLFINCGAGRRSVSRKQVIDLQGKASTIGRNLEQFVLSGGSLYVSDWAFLYVHLAFGDITWRTLNRNVDFTKPFDTNELRGFGEQTIDADIVDSSLAEYLGKDRVQIRFPRGTENGVNVSAYHWGLVDQLGPASALIRGDALMCNSKNNCDEPSGTARNTPLALMLDTVEGPGGAVIYTSFHNIAQKTADVGEILNYLVFKL